MISDLGKCFSYYACFSYDRRRCFAAENVFITGKAFLKGYCCSYKSDCGKTATGFDCAIIPSPSNDKGTALAIAYEGFCGGELSTANDEMMAKTVCCKFFFFILYD